jgi:GDP-4-dehydro-6-deoxy-D-mannose reductase
MASVLVTGAAGFIGRALCRVLRLRGHEVAELSSRDGDIADFDTLRRTGPAEHVFHLAGRTFVPDSWNDAVGFQRVNVLGTTNMLEFCRVHGARATFVSSYLYGIPERLPVSETCVPKPNNPYALSKHLAEQVCAFYATEHGIDITVIRPFNIYGPGQTEPFLIPQIVNQVREGQTIRVKDLTPRRDYLYIDDLVDALVRSLSGPDGYNVFNIGCGSSLSIGEVIAAVQSVAGTALPVISEGKARPNEISDVYADIGKARQHLGWFPSLTFEQGIERMVLEETDPRIAGRSKRE